MKLTVLCDNHTYIDRYYLGEPAFSALIEDGDTAVLFDAGYSDVFIENVRRMGVDLSKVTHVVLSHGHNDHTGGLSAFFERFHQPVTLIAHPEVFSKRYHEGLSVGSPIGVEDLPESVTLSETRGPAAITPRIFFLGEIPRVYPFERNRAVGERVLPNGMRVPDDLPDDTSLAILTENGLFLLSGCAHAGIANTLAYAKEVTGETRVDAVLGGMHLFDTDADFDAAVRALSALGVRTVWPCHCTSLAVKTALAGAFDVREAAVGLTLEL